MLKKLIDIEEAELGYREGAENITKYGAEYGLDGQPWCVMFQWWCAKRAGVPFPNTAHCNGVESYAKEHGQWVTNDFAVGDFVIFDYEKDGNRDHIGLVVEVDRNSLTTIEGNYADMVARVKRRTSEVVGAYRPGYEKMTEAEEDAQSLSQPAADSSLCTREPEDTSSTASGPPSPQGEGDAVPGAPASELGLPVLGVGDCGFAVGQLQRLLKGHGYRMSGSFTRSGKPDCEFGAETGAALFELTGSCETTGAAWQILIGGKSNE